MRDERQGMANRFRDPCCVEAMDEGRGRDGEREEPELLFLIQGSSR